MKKNQREEERKRGLQRVLPETAQKMIFRRDVTRNRAAIEDKKIRFLEHPSKGKEKKKRKKEKEKRKNEKDKKNGEKHEKRPQGALGCVEPLTLPERNTGCRIRYHVATSF